MAQLTPRDDIRKTAGEILKRVDQLIKAGEIERSVREIIHAKEIDPSNVYIHAYEERLDYLKEEHEKNAARERTRKQAEEAARQRDAEIRREQEEEQQKRIEELKRQEEARRTEKDRIVAEEERSRRKDDHRIRTVPAQNDTGDRLYADAYKKAWSTGNITPQQALTLQKLKQELGVSPDRQSQIEAQVLSELQSKPGAETILVIDDDEQMLQLIAQILTFHGYHVTSLSTSDEAYTLLKQWKPRLILSDINLETSTMGGFSFYEKVRELKNLNDVPFVFLTGLSDEVLIRTGKELGVDDYLTKPVSEQSLLATVKGKLKRFGRLGEKP